MLNPVFSTDSMREMTPIFNAISRKVLFTTFGSFKHAELALQQLNDVLRESLKSGPADLDILLLLSNAALEFISQAGMGHTFDLIRPDTDVRALHPMAHAVKSIAYVHIVCRHKLVTDWPPPVRPVQTELAVWWLFTAYFQKLGSPQLRRRLADLAISVIPDKNLGRMREIINTIDNIVKGIFCQRAEEVESDAEDDKQTKTSLNMLSILREFILCAIRKKRV